MEIGKAADDSNGRWIETTPEDFPVLPSMMHLPAWEWGEFARARARLGTELSQSLPRAVLAARQEMRSSTPEEFRELLEPVLNLVAPTGMGKIERGAWIKSAVMMLARMPRDLLAIGCHSAMRNCDHPSKIVPEIFRATKTMMTDRRAELNDMEGVARLARDGLDPKPWKEGMPFDVRSVCTSQRATEIMQEFGIETDADIAARRKFERGKLGPPRKPNRADYLKLGMTAEQCDAAGVPK